jgi:hypothetical protein
MGLLSRVEDTLTSAGLKITSQVHALSPDHMRYFGLMEVTNCQNNPDYNMVLGLRNSHDKKFPAGLVVGSGVFVCDNLAFSAEIRIDRKHTVFINRDLPQLVDAAIGRLGDVRRLQDQRIQTYKETEFVDAQVHDIVVRALDAKVVPVCRVPHVLKEWRSPRHPEFAQTGKTAWRLFNAFTETIKGRSLDILPRRTQALHGLLDVACGLTAKEN